MAAHASLAAAVRLAEALDISVDYLLIEGVSRRWLTHADSNPRPPPRPTRRTWRPRDTDRTRAPSPGVIDEDLGDGRLEAQVVCFLRWAVRDSKPWELEEARREFGQLTEAVKAQAIEHVTLVNAVCHWWGQPIKEPDLGCTRVQAR